MAQFEKKVMLTKNLTIIEVSGRVTLEELIDEISSFYRSEYTANLIWEFSNADVSEMQSDHLRQIICHAQKFVDLRQNGKTALVMPGSLAFGLGRMYEILAEIEDLPRTLAVVRDIREAMAWLDQKATQKPAVW
jgi:hypothetical protein